LGSSLVAARVRAGFAATATERTLGEWGQPLEVKRFKITEAGDRALSLARETSGNRGP